MAVDKNCIALHVNYIRACATELRNINAKLKELQTKQESVKELLQSAISVKKRYINGNY